MIGWMTPLSGKFLRGHASPVNDTYALIHCWMFTAT